MSVGPDEVLTRVRSDGVPDGDGLTLLAGLRQRGWQGRAILVTAYPSEQLARTAATAGYATIIEKPLRHEELLGSLAAA